MSGQTARRPRRSLASSGGQLMLSEELLGQWKAAFEAREEAIQADREALRKARPVGAAPTPTKKARGVAR